MASDRAACIFSTAVLPFLFLLADTDKLESSELETVAEVYLQKILASPTDWLLPDYASPATFFDT